MKKIRIKFDGHKYYLCSVKGEILFCHYGPHDSMYTAIILYPDQIIFNDLPHHQTWKGDWIYYHVPENLYNMALSSDKEMCILGQTMLKLWIINNERQKD